MATGRRNSGTKIQVARPPRRHANANAVTRKPLIVEGAVGISVIVQSLIAAFVPLELITSSLWRPLPARLK